MEDKKIRFAEASDGEMTKLVDNAVPGNTKMSTKYAVNVFELSFVFSVNKLQVNYIFVTVYYQATTVYNFRPIFNVESTELSSALSQFFVEARKVEEKP